MNYPAILATTLAAVLATPSTAQEPTPPIPFEVFKQRRQALMKRVKTGIVVLRGNGRGGAGLNGFTQKENFYYLTGIEQQNAALILFPETGEDLLLVEPFSRFTAQWEGERVVPSDSHAETTHFDSIRPVTSLPRILKEHLGKAATTRKSMAWIAKSRARRARPFSRPSSDDLVFQQVLEQLFPKLKLEDVNSHIRALRGVKSKPEIDCITAATRIACAGIAEAMKSAEPGVYEFQIAAAARYVFHRHGARKDAYAAIVGAGLNGCVLHYSANSKKTQPGELVVMDYAPKVRGYASDVTRTFPTDGKFTAEQRQLVQDVHDIQQILIGMVKPGARLSQISARCSKELLKRGYRSMHGPSHHVGLNVHDVGGDLLKPGMLITVEPGAYLPKKKMGCRIEDVILVTEDGNINLSAHLPSRPDEIEKLMQGKGVQQGEVGIGR